MSNPPRDPSSLPLPHLPRDATGPLNDLFKPRQSLRLSDGLAIQDYAGTPPELGPHWARIDLAIGSLPLSVFCPTSLVQHVLASQQIAPPAAESDIGALLLELALDKLLGQLETAIGHHVTLIAAHREAAPLPSDATRWLLLEQDGNSWPIALAGALAALQLLFDRWPIAQTPAAELPVSAIIRLGVTTLPANVINSLGLGDAVLFERSLRAPNGGKLVIANHLVADALWDNGWRLQNAPSAQHTDREAWLGQPRVSTGEDLTTGPRDIPVTICFDIGDATLLAGEIKQLGKNSLLPLPDAAATPIRLTVDGHCIGSGDPIRIDGKPGVRILKLYAQ